MIIKKILLEKGCGSVEELSEQLMHSVYDDCSASPMTCTSCGKEGEPAEPDASGTCNNCEGLTVGAETLLLMLN
jgi:hypothetical protein